MIFIFSFEEYIARDAWPCLERVIRSIIGAKCIDNFVAVCIFQFLTESCFSPSLVIAAGATSKTFAFSGPGYCAVLFGRLRTLRAELSVMPIRMR